MSEVRDTLDMCEAGTRRLLSRGGLRQFDPEEMRRIVARYSVKTDARSIMNVIESRKKAVADRKAAIVQAIKDGVLTYRQLVEKFPGQSTTIRRTERHLKIYAKRESNAGTVWLGIKRGKGIRHPKTERDIDRVIKLLRAGEPMADIVRKLRVTYTTARLAEERCGIEAPRFNSTNLERPTDEQIVEAYKTSGLGIRALAQQLKLGTHTVSRALREARATKPIGGQTKHGAGKRYDKSQADLEEACKLLREGAVSTRIELKKRIGAASYHVIYRAMKETGIDLPCGHAHPVISDEQIERELRANGGRTKLCAQTIHCGQKRAMAIAKKLGINHKSGRIALVRQSVAA